MELACFAEAVTGPHVQERTPQGGLHGFDVRAIGWGCWAGSRRLPACFRVLEAPGGGDLGGRAPCPARRLFIDRRSTPRRKPSSC